MDVLVSSLLKFTKYLCTAVYNAFSATLAWGDKKFKISMTKVYKDRQRSPFSLYTVNLWHAYFTCFMIICSWVSQDVKQPVILLTTEHYKNYLVLALCYQSSSIFYLTSSCFFCVMSKQKHQRGAAKPRDEE